MPKILGVDIAKALNKGMGKLLLPATITRTTRSALSTPNPTGPGTVTTTTHTARGFTESYALSLVDGTNVKRGDLRVSLLGDSIKPFIELGPGDRVVIEGKTLTVVALEGRDPAGAMFLVQARGG